MTDNPSHPSPWPGGRKPRAMSPRTAHDYSLLAATVACAPAPSEIVSREMGFEEEYAERLQGSTAGRAFTEWLWQQPKEFIRGIQICVNSQPEPGTKTEKGPAPGPDPPTPPPSAQAALAKFFPDSAEDE